MSISKPRVDNGRLLAYLAATAKCFRSVTTTRAWLCTAAWRSAHLGRMNDRTAIVRPHRNGDGPLANGNRMFVPGNGAARSESDSATLSRLRR